MVKSMGFTSIKITIDKMKLTSPEDSSSPPIRALILHTQIWVSFRVSTIEDLEGAIIIIVT